MCFVHSLCSFSIETDWFDISTLFRKSRRIRDRPSSSLANAANTSEEEKCPRSNRREAEVRRKPHCSRAKNIPSSKYLDETLPIGYSTSSATAHLSAFASRRNV